MNKAFNKLGSIEIEGSTLKYRIAIQELNIEDPIELEKEIKRKINQVEDDSFYVLPFDIQVVNRYMILYYDLSHFASMDYLRELDLIDKIPFFLSLIKLAKEQEKGFNISWERLNFIADKFENVLKVFLFETESIKIYETNNDLLKRVKELIVSAMTNLTVFIGLPKRHDFYDPSELNIRFVENIYRMGSLDDLEMYLETISLDIEQTHYTNQTVENEEAQNKQVETSKGKGIVPFVKKEKEIKKNNSKSKTKVKHKKDVPRGKRKKKRNNWQLVYGSIAVGICLVLYFLQPVLIPTAKTEEPVVELSKSTSEKGGSQFDTALVDVYRNAYNSDYESAYKVLETLNKNDLTDLDVPLLIEVYESTNNLAVLLDTVPEVSNDVITYLYTRNKLNNLPTLVEGMTTINPYIEFEKAYLKQDYEKLLTLVSDVKINGRKEQQIMDAYLGLNKVGEARKFAESVGNPDLIKKVEEFRN